MPLIQFNDLPDSAKLWIFAAEKPIDTADIGDFFHTLDAFLDAWQAHGKALGAGRDLRYGQFLMIAADENIEAPSGCSIDTLTREVVAIGRKFGVNFLSSALVSYRERDKIFTTDRQDFKKLIEAGQVTLDTIVFDHSLEQLSQLREAKWELAAADSWHGKAFKFPVTS